MKESNQITAWLRGELQKHIDETYKQFHTSLVPGLTKMMGVRIPILRELAKKAGKRRLLRIHRGFSTGNL